ncbi:hypothetical protein JCM16303_000586 [Sporobolomyces ruberrimus]
MLSRWTTRSVPLATKAHARFTPSPHLVLRSTCPSPPQPSALRFVHNGGRKETVEARPLSGPKLKALMIDHLSHSRPRAALDLFVSHLSVPSQSHSSRTLEGLIWIFFQYRQPRLALTAIERLHEKGYRFSSRLGAKLLRSSQNELLFDPEGLVKVLNWIKEGIERDKVEGKVVDQYMVETVMDVLKRMGRNDWNARVFEAYRGTLGDGQVGEPRLWAAAISAQAAGGDIKAAQLLFRDWRTLYLASRPDSPSAPPPPPPEQPYLALLNHFAVNSPPLPASKDPAYLLLQLMKADSIPASTPFLNALLRTELARKRFSSFWGIWNLFDKPEVISLGITRDHSTWKLASRSKLVSDESRRLRGRIHHSPLLHLSPLPYTESYTPPSRLLFSLLLSTRLSLTSHRPSLRLTTSKPDPLSTTPTSSHPPSPSSSTSTNAQQQSPSILLNSFLSLFLSIKDFPAAVIVLETFHVHSISPTATTHSSVVLSIIKLWEKGKLEPRIDRNDTDGIFGFGRGTLVSEEEVERRRRRRAGRNLGGDEVVGVIRGILEKRKFRVGLWQQRQLGKQHARQTSEGRIEEGRGEENEPSFEGGEEELEFGQSGEPPKWMVQREVRDTGYLVDLLEKASGLERDDWRQVLEQTRREVLPPRRRGGVDNLDDPSGREKVQEGQRKVTRGARYRKEAFGKEFSR